MINSSKLEEFKERVVLSKLENTANAKTGFKGTLDVDKHVERFAGNVTPYQNSNLNFTDKTKNSAQFF